MFACGNEKVPVKDTFIKSPIPSLSKLKSPSFVSKKLLPELPLSNLIPAVVENPLPRISKLVLVRP